MIGDNVDHDSYDCNQFVNSCFFATVDDGSDFDGDDYHDEDDDEDDDENVGVREGTSCPLAVHSADRVLC